MSDGNTFVQTYVAGGAITAGLVVKADVAGTASLATAPSDPILGIAKETVGVGELVPVVTRGMAKATAGAALSVGVTRSVSVDASSKVVTAVLGDKLVGTFEGKASAVADDEVDVYVAFGKES